MGTQIPLNGFVGLRLTKYQALGNDYLVLDLPAPLERVVPKLPRICDRHLGPGSDGLLAFEPTPRTEVAFWEFYDLPGEGMVCLW